MTSTGTATGSVSAVSGSNPGTVFSVTVSSVSGDGTLRLDLKNLGTGITDVPGNPISGGFTSGQTYVIDQTAPSVAITSTATNPTGTSPIPVTITFSESVTGFAIGDIVVSGGTASNFSGSGANYTVDITPAATGTITVDITGGVATDAAGNNNTAATQFSIDYDSTLPVVLTSFTVTSEGNKARIKWTTASEQSNDRFEIERSSDGRTFYKLVAVAGHGTINAPQSYEVMDLHPLNGANYYRLLQYDWEAHQKELGIGVASFKLADAIVLMAYPNPAKTAINLQLQNYSGKDIHVSMNTMNGMVIHQEVIQTNSGQLSYPLHLAIMPPAGQYILNITGTDSLNKSLRVVVQ